jgi:non-specific serine/threonine protein kinase
VPLGPARPHHNLPAQLTFFVGREKELAEIVTRLRAATRLLTLTGTGGCGKTRLALQVAAELTGDFADGVWLVELAPLTNPELVPDTVAAALGVREESSRPIQATLLAALRSNRVLLILDNCEHLLDASARVVDALLRGCPELQLLTTSRESLGIPGEVSWRVPSLAVPAVDQLPPLAELVEVEAVRLFVNRAQAVQPSFRVTIQNAEAVAQICRRLDGIPLALELAAARLKGLSVEQIASRLDQRFRLLTGGSRAALPRQQTLAALVGWSYDLLSEPQRILFSRLSVFAGGFTLEAAEAVAGVGGREAGTDTQPPTPSAQFDVFDLLGQLVDKSLVLMESSGTDSSVRYRLLETLRQYGQEKLLASGETSLLRQRHLAWCVDLARGAEAGLTGPDQAGWLDRLEAEHDNLRAAQAWSLDPSAAKTPIATSQGPLSAVEAGLLIATGTWWFWFLRVHRQEYWRWMEQALPRSSGVAEAIRLRAQQWAGTIGMRGGGPWKEAQALLEASLARYRELGSAQGIAQAGGDLCAWLASHGDFAAARALAREAVASARVCGDDNVLALTLIDGGLYAGVFDDLERGKLAEEALALSQKTGNVVAVAMSYRILGRIGIRRGDYDEARRCFSKDLRQIRHLGDTFAVVDALCELGDILLLQGDLAGARDNYAEARKLCEAIGYGEALTACNVIRRQGRLALIAGESDRAEAAFKQALAIYRTEIRKPGVGRCLAGLADVAQRRGQPTRAARLLAAAEPLSSDDEAPWERIERERLTGGIRSQMDESEFAAAWAEGQAMTMEQAVAYALSDDSPEG